MIAASLNKELNTADGKSTLKVELNLLNGKVTSVYGASGVGKTMILRMLAGLERPDHGFIKNNDQYWFNSSEKNGLSIGKRAIGFVFQDYGLFPNMSIEENLRFALNDGDEKLIPYYIGEFGLTALKNNKPAQLSGGQKQRTAIARALIFKPRLLLLDEPFTAQDKKMSIAVGHEIKRYTEEQNCVTVLVTHNIAATLALANYVYKIAGGAIVEEGTVKEVFMRGSKENGITGIVADIKGSGDGEVLVILINESVIEVRSKEKAGEYNVGDEIYLSIDQESGIFAIKTIHN